MERRYLSHCRTIPAAKLLFTLVSYDFFTTNVVSNSNISLKISTFGSCDIVGHVAVRLAIYGVLQVANYNHTLILHVYGDLKLKDYGVTILTFWDHVTSSFT